MKKLLLVFLLTLALLAGCSPAQQVTTIEGQERDDVLAYAEPMADSLFAAMNEKDYATFSKDLDPAMLKSIDEKAFTSMVDMFNGKIGAYQSRAVQKVEKVGDIYVVSYAAKYENEDPVSVRFNVRGGSPPQVVGLWFDSPRLRQK